MVTVLFADLVGFTALSEQLDAEDVAIVQDRYFRAARDAIEERTGQVEKFIGDAVVGTFGVHHARDSVSWIPSEAVVGLTSLPFDIGVTHYDEPPPDMITDLHGLRAADRFASPTSSGPGSRSRTGASPTTARPGRVTWVRARSSSDRAR